MGATTAPKNAAPDTDERGWSAVRIIVAVVVLIAIFGFAFPQVADYGEAWAALGELTSLEMAALLAVWAWNVFTYWPLMVASLPGLKIREAAVVNNASTAIANTVPAGGAVALGVTYRMLRDWGFTTESITNQVLLSGAWNTLVKLLVPILAVAGPPAAPASVQD